MSIAISHSKKSATLLIVDDSPVTRYKLRQFFEELDYHVEEAGNGAEAYTLFSECKPDLVLMDLHMPVMDGLTAYKKIKSYHFAQHTPVIIITTVDEERLIDKAFEIGVVDYITKPIHWAVLKNRVDYLLRAKQAESQLFEEKEFAQATLKSIGDAVIITSANSHIQSLNPAAEKLTGWLNEEAQNKHLNQVFKLILESSRTPVTNIIEQTLDKHQHTQQEHMLIRQDNEIIDIEETITPIHDRESNIIGFVIVFRDVSAQREKARRMHYHASHDALTGLINRREFERRAQRSILSAQQHDTQHALMFMDLDKFKHINDTCGHASGDEVLRQITTLMQTHIRKRDNLARLGGDEFALLLENCNLNNAKRIAEHIRKSVENYQLIWQGQSFRVGVSIGITMINQNSISLESVVNLADTACYAAKNAGRNCIRVTSNEQ